MVNILKINTVKIQNAMKQYIHQQKEKEMKQYIDEKKEEQQTVFEVDENDDALYEIGDNLDEIKNNNIVPIESREHKTTISDDEDDEDDEDEYKAMETKKNRHKEYWKAINHTMREDKYNKMWEQQCVTNQISSNKENKELISKQVLNTELSPFERIDFGLNQYYKKMGKTDYKNKNGKGKFIKYVEDNDLDEDDINDELNCGAHDCLYPDFDPKFPLKMNGDNDKYKKEEKIFDIIMNCYKYGQYNDEIEEDTISKPIDSSCSDFKENKPLKKRNRKRKRNVKKDVAYNTNNNYQPPNNHDVDITLERIHDAIEQKMKIIQSNVDELDATIYEKECYLFSQQTAWRYHELLRMEQYTMIKKGIENMVSTVMMSTEIRNIAQKQIESLDKIDKLRRKQIICLDQICENGQIVDRWHCETQSQHELKQIDANDCELDEMELEDIERKQREALQGKESKKKNTFNSKLMHSFRLQNKRNRLQKIEKSMARLHRMDRTDRIHKICDFHHQFEHYLNAEIEGKQNNMDETEKLLLITENATDKMETIREKIEVEKWCHELMDTMKEKELNRKVCSVIHKICEKKFNEDITELKKSGQIEIGKQGAYKNKMSKFVETEPFQRFKRTKLKIDVFEFKVYLYPNGTNTNNKGMVQYLVKLDIIPNNIESVVVYVKLYCKQSNSKYMSTTTFHQNEQQNICVWHNHLSLEQCKQCNYMNFQYEIQILQINRLEKEKGNKLMTTDHCKAPLIARSNVTFYIHKYMLSTIKFSKKMNNIWYQPDLNGDNSIFHSLELNQSINGNKKDINISWNVFKFPPKILKYDVTFTLSINHKKLNIKQSKNCVIDYSSTECKIKLNKKQKEMLLSSQLPQNQKLCMKLRANVNKIWIRDYPNTPQEIQWDHDKNKKKYKQEKKEKPKTKKPIKYSNNNKRKKKNKKFNKTKTQKKQIINDNDSKEDKINGIDNNNREKIPILRISVNPGTSKTIYIRTVNNGKICIVQEDEKETEQQQKPQQDIDDIYI